MKSFFQELLEKQSDKLFASLPRGIIPGLEGYEQVLAGELLPEAACLAASAEEKPSSPLASGEFHHVNTQKVETEAAALPSLELPIGNSFRL